MERQVPVLAYLKGKQKLLLYKSVVLADGFLTETIDRAIVVVNNILLLY